ncbi:MAG: hypothetical protein JSV22_00945 [Bacteroidales bacterium]|nr:MAG: hypothetical protein JSV22_00945 [Bacteroidales bacterium]
MEQKEKSRTFLDWRPGDKGDTIGWGLILILGALIVLGNSVGFGDNYSWWNAWGIFFIGIGIIGLVGAIIRFLVREYPSPSFWDILFAVFFLFLGMGNKTGWIWAVALIVIGFSVIRSAYQKSKK